MVTWSDRAIEDLRHIHDFIATDSRSYAKMVVHGIADATLKLSAHSRIGKVVPELNNSDIRELHMYSYRILYSIIAEQIHVLAVVHMRRDFPPSGLT